MKKIRKTAIISIISLVIIGAVVLLIWNPFKENDDNRIPANELEEKESDVDIDSFHASEEQKSDVEDQNITDLPRSDENIALLPEDHVSSDTTANVFSMSAVEPDKDTVTVQLSLGGKVSICRYSASIMFDSNCLELKDYDAELSTFAPIVYPGKNDDGSISEVPEAGMINLEWASANNRTKEGEIITLVFKKSEGFSGTTAIVLKVHDVNSFKDDVVVDVEYNAKSLVVEAK